MTTLAVVGLLAGAFELILQVISATVFVSIGVIAWRWWTGEPALPKLRSISVRDLLLATGYCAVIAAVASRTPEFRVFDWGGMVGTGLAISLPTLLAAWMVYGAERWSRRLFGAGVFLGVALAAYGLRGLWYWFTNPQTQPRYPSFWAGVVDWFSPNQLGWQWNAYGPTLLIGFAVLCLALLGAKDSGWFAKDTGDQPGWRRWAARLALVAPLLLMGSLDLRVLWELTHPTPIPAEETISPNGWDDIVAAGAMFPRNLARQPGFEAMPEAELTALITKLGPVYERVKLGLSKPSRALSSIDWLREQKNNRGEIEQRMLDAYYADLAFAARTAKAKRRDDQSAQVDATLVRMQIAAVEWRSACAHRVWRTPTCGQIAAGPNKLRAELNANDARLMLTALIRFESEQPQFSILESRQRIFDENSGWMRHLQLLADDWSGIDHYRNERLRYKLMKTLLRITITEYAVRLFVIDNQRRPDSLAQLAPEYLPRVPLDPFDEKPLRYRLTGDGYLLYSVGSDKIDDGGEPASNVYSEPPEPGDLTAELLRSL